jgi:hypothetical protein
VGDRHSKTLTVAEADSAIYIDFEGAQDEPPVLLGALYAEGTKKPDQGRLVMRHDLVDWGFAPLPNAIRPQWPWIYRYDSAMRSLSGSYSDLVGRARAQNRLLVAWSRHELDASLEAGLPRSLREEFVERFRDGKATAKRWKRLTFDELVFERDERKRLHTLARYADLTGFLIPEENKEGKVGQSIRRVRSGLDRSGEWAGLAAGQQEAWRMVLTHNISDCFSLRHVVRTAASELEELGVS